MNIHISHDELLDRVYAGAARRIRARKIMASVAVLAGASAVMIAVSSAAQTNGPQLQLHQPLASTHPAPKHRSSGSSILTSTSAVSGRKGHSDTSTAPTTRPTPPLRATAYGVWVPIGWVERALHGSGGPLLTASFTDPSGRGSIEFAENGGSASVTYRQDRTGRWTPAIDLARGLARCRVRTWTAIDAHSATFSCSSDSVTVEVLGLLRIGPYPQGSRAIIVTNPLSRHRVTEAIIARSLREK